MRSPRLRFLLVLLAAFALLAAACGDDDDVSVTGDTSDSSDGEAPGEGAEDGDAFPVTVDSAGTELTIESKPEAIVSMSPTMTEILFAIGAGDEVIAADSYSNYPPDVPMTELSSFEPNVEAIIEFEPDLVVLSDDRNDVVSGLDTVGIPALVVPAAATLDETYAAIEIVGAATGHVGDAAEVVSQMQTDIDELAAEVAEREQAPTFYHELDNTLYSVTSETFIGEIYTLAGLENVADAADPDGELGGYPQLSAEFLVDADPDFIFLADTKCCSESLETVGQRAGFAELSAVTEGRVVELDDDIASRWGPRVVDFLRTIIDATADVKANS